MCTSFVTRAADILVAMNFDYNKPYELRRNSRKFTVFAESGRGKYPSFGVNSDGTFINNLYVDGDGKGLYKRAGKKVTHTSKLTNDILTGTIAPGDIGRYLSDMEIVNTPDFSVHNMIADKAGNVWIIEPGCGILYSSAEETPYVLMTNFSLYDMEQQGGPYGNGADRYRMAKAILDREPIVSIPQAFGILETVEQTQGEWITVFSLVYSPTERTVYYCKDGNFQNILSHSFG